MRHEVFGLFDHVHSASAALAELKRRSEVDGRCSFVVHRDAIEGERTDPQIAHEERGLREGVRFGGLLGAVGSAATLALLEGPLRLVGAGPAFAALVGAGAGTAAGAAIGAIVGSGWGDTNFQKLVSHLKSGKVLVSVNVDGLTCEHEVEDILRRNRATTTHRAIF
ncbi:MAG TPA: hypothetical protein VMT03_07110 [Polyangia bacterium]|nr:hypothetical protein [Polyangia bacterium]